MMKGLDNQPQSAAGWSPAEPPMQTPGRGRALTLIRLLTAQAGIMVVCVGFAEMVMPAEIKPSAIIGRFHGNIDAVDALTKQQAVVELARRQTEAQVREGALAAIEQEASRQQQQAIYDSQTMKGGMANFADLLCMGGSLIPQDTGNRDMRTLGHSMRQACGAGDMLRADMIENSVRAGRQGSTVFRRTTPAPAR